MARIAVHDLLFGRRETVTEEHSIPWATPVVVGRVLLAAMFVGSGVGKMFDWGATVAYMQQEGMTTWTELWLAGAVAVEVLAGLAVVTGTLARLGAWLLVLFLIPATLIFHDFWAYSGLERQAQMAHFLKNLSVMGGLLLIAGYGAGPLSGDARVDRLRS
jgi:putative oxidoreductase